MNNLFLKGALIFIFTLSCSAFAWPWTKPIIKHKDCVLNLVALNLDGPVSQILTEYGYQIRKVDSESDLTEGNLVVTDYSYEVYTPNNPNCRGIELTIGLGKIDNAGKMVTFHVASEKVACNGSRVNDVETVFAMSDTPYCRLEK